MSPPAFSGRNEYQACANDNPGRHLEHIAPLYAARTAQRTVPYPLLIAPRFESRFGPQPGYDVVTEKHSSAGIQIS